MLAGLGMATFRQLMIIGNDLEELRS